MLRHPAFKYTGTLALGFLLGYKITQVIEARTANHEQQVVVVIPDSMTSKAVYILPQQTNAPTPVGDIQASF